MFTSLCQFGLGVTVAFSGNYYFFVVLRFLLAMVSAAAAAPVGGGAGSNNFALYIFQTFKNVT